MAAAAAKESMTKQEAPKDLSLMMTKYRAADDAASSVMKFILDKITPGADIRDLCQVCDERIVASVKSVFTKCCRGVAFPTAISPNHIFSNFSPTKKDAAYMIREGDAVKVEFGLHIDGFASFQCRTVIVNTAKATIDDFRGDCFVAVNLAARALITQLSRTPRTFTVGQAKEIISLIAEDFKCKVVGSSPFSVLNRFKIKDNDAVKVDEPFFDEKDIGKTWSFNVMMSSARPDSGVADGTEKKEKKSELRHTIYDRIPEAKYGLKLKASRQFFSQLSALTPSTYPFNLRAFEEEIKACRPAVTECFDHGLLNVYDIFEGEKGKDVVCKVRFVIVMMEKPVVFGFAGDDSDAFISTTLSLTNTKIQQIFASATSAISATSRKSRKSRKIKSAAATVLDAEIELP